MAKQPSRRVVDMLTRQVIGEDPATQNTGELSVDDINEIKIALAEQRSDLKHILEAVKNMSIRQDAQSTLFMPRQEIEAKLSSLDARVSKLENNQTWVTRAVVLAWIAGIGVVFTMAKAVVPV